jgi:hypothetical protein
VILLVSVLSGLVIGVSHAYLKKQSYKAPDLRFSWLAILAFVPQYLAFYLPASRNGMPDSQVSILLVASQVFLLVFAYLNRHLVGMWLLIGGLVLNLAVISLNGGLMPISPGTLSRLVPEASVQSLPLNHRVGKGKDILLLPEDTRLQTLSDKFITPQWSPVRAAFSLGDVFVAAGAFWLLVYQPSYRKKDV